MVEIKNVTVHYDSNPIAALSDVSFTVRNRKIYGLLGPRGAGKSTLMNVIAGALEPTEGLVLINGYDIAKMPLAAKKQIGYLPEDPALFPDLTPYEALEFVGLARGVKGESLHAQIKEALSVTGLLGVQDRLIRNLSRGYCQKVGLAQALMGAPDVILLDEPTEGLDPRQVIEIRELIQKLGQTKSVLVSSHVLADIRSYCDHIIILSEGRVIADDVPEMLDCPEDASALTVTIQGDGAGVRELLGEVKGVLSVTVMKATAESAELRVVTDGTPGVGNRLTFALTQARHTVLSVETNDQSLEEAFLTLTQAADEVQEAEYEEDTD